MLRIFGFIFCLFVMGLFRCAPETSIDNKTNQTPSGESLSMNSPDGTSTTIAGNVGSDETSSTNLGLELVKADVRPNSLSGAISTSTLIQNLVNQKNFNIKIDATDYTISAQNYLKQHPDYLDAYPRYSQTPTSKNPCDLFNPSSSSYNWSNMGSGTWLNSSSEQAINTLACKFNYSTPSSTSSELSNFVYWMGTFFNRICGIMSNAYTTSSSYSCKVSDLTFANYTNSPNTIWLEYTVPIDSNGSSNCGWSSSFVQVKPDSTSTWQQCRVPVENLVAKKLAPGQTALGNLLSALTSMGNRGTQVGLFALIASKTQNINGYSMINLDPNFPSTHFTIPNPASIFPHYHVVQQSASFSNKRIQSLRDYLNYSPPGFTADPNRCWIAYSYYDGTCNPSNTFNLIPHSYTVSGTLNSNLYQINFAKDSTYWAFNSTTTTSVDIAIPGSTFTLGVSDNPSNGTTGSIATQYAFRVYTIPGTNPPYYILKNMDNNKCVYQTSSPYIGDPRYQYAWHNCSITNDPSEQFIFK